MTVFLSPVGGAGAQFFDNNGNPLSGGKLYTYSAGTATPQATYTTSQGNVPWTNPIVLDAAGRVPSSSEIWLADDLLYKFVLKDANDVLIATYDNISGVNSVDASRVTYDPPFIGSVITNVEAKLAQTVSVKDFGAVGDGVTDDTAAIQAAVNYAMANKIELYFPEGTYLVRSINTGSNLRAVGAGPAASVLRQTAVGAAIFYAGDSSNKSNIYIESLGFDVNQKDSGIYVTNVSSFTVKNCDIGNNPFWGIHVGIESARANTTTMTCEDVLIDNCRFYNSTSTYEHIVLFNGQNMVVRDCHFVGAMNGGIGVGLYQNLRHVKIRGCFFRDITKGMFYSVTTNDISITDCEFQGCTIGIQGANESDWGLFGELWVYGLQIDTCRFYANAWALEIGSVRGGSVSNCRFAQNIGNAVVFSKGNRLATPTIQQSVNVTLSGCHFLNNNTSGVLHDLHPAILFDEGGGVMYVTLHGCTFEDSQATKTQYYPIGFNGPFSWEGIRLFGCRLASYGTGASIGLSGGASINDVRLYGCTDLSALPSGATVAA